MHKVYVILSAQATTVTYMHQSQHSLHLLGARRTLTRQSLDLVQCHHNKVVTYNENNVQSCKRHIFQETVQPLGEKIAGATSFRLYRVYPTQIMQITSQKNIQPIDNYCKINEVQHREISRSLPNSAIKETTIYHHAQDTAQKQLYTCVLFCNELPRNSSMGPP